MEFWCCLNWPYVIVGGTGDGVFTVCVLATPLKSHNLLLVVLGMFCINLPSKLDSSKVDGIEYLAFMILDAIF